LAVDTRDFPGHALRGGVYRLSRSDYTSRDPSTRFARYEAEATHFIPLADGRLVFATHGWIASTSPTSGETPFYLLPSLGGNNSLRGYPDFRFRDRAMLLLNAEARVALLTHLDTVAFVDAGNVAVRPSLLDLALRSYGAGVRVHSRRATFARLDLARSREGWRVVVKVADPFNSWRTARRTAVVPFTP
jgi:outer membrane protein assembly factor BamA